MSHSPNNINSLTGVTNRLLTSDELQQKTENLYAQNERRRATKKHICIGIMIVLIFIYIAANLYIQPGKSDKTTSRFDDNTRLITLLSGLVVFIPLICLVYVSKVNIKQNKKLTIGQNGKWQYN